MLESIPDGGRCFLTHEQFLQCHSPEQIYWGYLNPTFHLNLDFSFLEFEPSQQWEVLPKTFFWNPNFLKMHWLIFQKHLIYSNALEGNDNSFQVHFWCYHAESHSGHTWNCGLCDDGALIWVIWKNTVLEVVTNAVLDAIFQRLWMRGTEEAWESAQQRFQISNLAPDL